MRSLKQSEKRQELRGGQMVRLELEDDSRRETPKSVAQGRTYWASGRVSEGIGRRL